MVTYKCLTSTDFNFLFLVVESVGFLVGSTAKPVKIETEALLMSKVLFILRRVNMFLRFTYQLLFRFVGLTLEGGASEEWHYGRFFKFHLTRPNLRGQIIKFDLPCTIFCSGSIWFRFPLIDLAEKFDSINSEIPICLFYPIFFSLRHKFPMFHPTWAKFAFRLLLSHRSINQICHFPEFGNFVFWFHPLTFQFLFLCRHDRSIQNVCVCHFTSISISISIRIYLLCPRRRLKSAVNLTNRSNVPFLLPPMTHFEKVSFNFL